MKVILTFQSGKMSDTRRDLEFDAGLAAKLGIKENKLRVRFMEVYKSVTFYRLTDKQGRQYIIRVYWDLGAIDCVHDGQLYRDWAPEQADKI